jgi:lysophospholipase L1-like esterase
MSRILVYGDSLTWGYDAVTGGRFPIEQVWPALMARELGADVEVLVEALPGRTTVFDSPYAPGRNGAELLLPLLQSHAPENRAAESQQLARHYRTIADRAGVSFFDAATVVRPAEVDGVHLDLAGNARLGPAIAQAVRPLLPVG